MIIKATGSLTDGDISEKSWDKLRGNIEPYTVYALVDKETGADVVESEIKENLLGEIEKVETTENGNIIFTILTNMYNLVNLELYGSCKATSFDKDKILAI